MNEIKNNWKMIFPAFFYGLSVVIVTMLPYIPNNFIVIFSSLFLLGLFYAVLIKLKDKWKKRLCVISYFLCFYLIYLGFNIRVGETGFYTWLLTGYDYNDMFIPYIILLLFVCVLFFGASSYYFSHFYFRGYIMIFMLLIPVALYYKMIESVPSIYIIVVLIALFLLYISGVQKRNMKDIKLLPNKAMFRFVGCFVLVIVITTAICPKSDVAEYREKFDEIISMNPFSNRNITTISTVSDSSASRNYGYLNQTRLVYTGIGYENLYLRRSAYYKYTGEGFVNGTRYKEDNWEHLSEQNSMRNFYENMIVLYENHPEVFEKYNVSFESIPNVTEETMTVRLTPKNFNADYFLATVRTYSITTDKNRIDESITKDVYDCYQSPYILDVEYESYMLTYYRDIARTNENILRFAECFESIDNYQLFINELISVNEDLKISVWLENIKGEVEVALSFRNVNSNESSRIKELAESITAGCTTDYEKACAIENYFKENDYTYNLAADPDDYSVEYFLFESKEGACGDFATAMTLMAQSIGLPARYVEGFVMSKQYSDGTYYVTTGDSHAYVEIYIPGYGYTVFEPTKVSASQETEGVISEAINRFTEILEVNKDNIYTFLLILLVVFVCVAIFYKFVLFRVQNICMVFVCKRAKARTEKAYSYIQKILSPYTEQDVKSMTPAEVNNFVKEKYQIDISEFTETIEKKAYSQSNEEIQKKSIKRLVELRNATRIKKKTKKVK